MRHAEDIKKLIKNTKIRTNSDVNKAVLNGLLNRLDKAESVHVDAKQPNIWRIIMKSSFTKLTAAAAIIVVVGLAITFLDKSNTAAYALEQTIQANHTVRFIHVRVSDPTHEEPTEFWAEFDNYGSVQNLRGEIPAWIDKYGEDGAKSFVWKNDKAQIWLPKKNIFITIKNKSVAAQTLLLFLELDPKLAVERLNEKASNGKVKVEVVEPSNVSEAITITATSLPNESLNKDFLEKAAAANKSNADEPAARAASIDPNMLCNRIILYVDQATKLVTSIELYRLKDGDYQKTGTIEYFDYNQPIAASVFALNIPADAIIVDQTSQEIGLLQGQLTEKEVAVEVVRQFMEAMIVKDYAKASPLYEGIPAEKLEREFFPKLKIVKIVSIGEPVPSILTGGYKVPCVLEIEENGKTRQWSPFGPFVRQVHGQPGRWTICGGI